MPKRGFHVQNYAAGIEEPKPRKEKEVFDVITTTLTLYEAAKKLIKGRDVHMDIIDDDTIYIRNGRKK